MIQTTLGIVLHKTRYSDNAHIIKIFTRSLGLQPFYVTAGRKKSVDHNLYSSLNILELELHFKENTSIQRLVSVRKVRPLPMLIFDLRKSSIALFVAELLFKTLPEDYRNPDLFDFIMHSVEILEGAKNCTGFHLWFLVRLLQYYGISPTPEDDNNNYFDLQNGHFISSPPTSLKYMDTAPTRLLIQLLDTKSSDPEAAFGNRECRKVLLESLIEYLYIHIDGMRQIKSHKVFEDINNKFV